MRLDYEKEKAELAAQAEENLANAKLEIGNLQQDIKRILKYMVIFGGAAAIGYLIAQNKGQNNSGHAGQVEQVTSNHKAKKPSLFRKLLKNQFFVAGTELLGKQALKTLQHIMVQQMTQNNQKNNQQEDE